MKGFVNVCRHRGSTLLTAPCGDGLRSIRCPYHAWTYGLDGALTAFPGAEPGFDDVDKTTHGLIEVPVAEQFGLVFAVADPAAGPFDAADALHGAEVELADFDIGAYRHVESRQHEWAMNWKLAMDTFTEPYHIPWLHKDSIAPYYLFDRWIHDAFGPHQRFIGCRKSVLVGARQAERGRLGAPPPRHAAVPAGAQRRARAPDRPPRAVAVHPAGAGPHARAHLGVRPARRASRRRLLRQEPRRAARRHEQRGLPDAGAGAAQPGIGRDARAGVREDGAGTRLLPHGDQRAPRRHRVTTGHPSR